MENCQELQDYIVDINDTSLLHIEGDGLAFANRSCVNKENDLLARHFNDYEAAGFTSAYTLLTVISLFGNCLMLYIVVRRTIFRTTPNILLVSLNVSNIFLSAMWIPLLWRPTYSRIFDNNTFFCKIAKSFAGINVCCTEIVISVIIVYYVWNPRRLFRLNLRLSILLAVLLWLCAYAVNAINLSMHTTKSISINVTQAIELKIDYHFLPTDSNGTMSLKYCVFEVPRCKSGRKCFFEYTEYHYKLIQTIIVATFLYILPFLIFSTRLFVKQCFQKYPFSSNSEISREIRTINCLLMLVAQIYALMWLPRICLALYLNAIQLQGGEVMKHAKVVQEICSFISLFSTCAVPAVFGLKDEMFYEEFKVVFSHVFCCLPHYYFHSKYEEEICGTVLPIREPPVSTVHFPTEAESSFPLIDEEETALNNNDK